MAYKDPEDQRAAARRHYEKHKEAIKARTRQDVSARREMKRQIVWAAKDKPCLDCGIQYPPTVMEFDHVRGTKIAAISTMSSASKYTFDTLVAEIEKCDLVCANCHRIRHWNERTHPKH